MSARSSKRQRFAATCRRAREWRAAAEGRDGVTIHARPTAHGVDCVIRIDSGSKQVTTKGSNTMGRYELLVPSQDADLRELIDDAKGRKYFSLDWIKSPDQAEGFVAITRELMADSEPKPPT